MTNGDVFRDRQLGFRAPLREEGRLHRVVASVFSPIDTHDVLCRLWSGGDGIQP